MAKTFNNEWESILDYVESNEVNGTKVEPGAPYVHPSLANTAPPETKSDRQSVLAAIHEYNKLPVRHRLD